MKMNVSFSESKQFLNPQFDESKQAFRADYGKLHTIHGKDGKDGKDGYTPVKGVDYFTEADKQEIAEQAAQLVDIPEGGGGVTSWNDLTDKPFGDVPAVFDIQWDGDMTDRTVLDLSALGFDGAYLVKVSDKVYTKEELIGKCLWYSDGYSEEIGETSFSDQIPGTFGVFDASIAVCYSADEANAALGTDFISEGVYFFAEPAYNAYVSALETPATLKTIEEKYLPDSVATKDEIPNVDNFATKDEIVKSYNDLTDKPFGDVLDFSTVVHQSMGKLKFSETSSGRYSAQNSGFDGLVFTSGKIYRIRIAYMNTAVYAEFEGKARYDSVLQRFQVTDDANNGFYYYTSDGVLSVWCGSSNPSIADPNYSSLLFVTITKGNEVAIPLDPKYLPESVLTTDDMNAITQSVINALPIYNGEVVTE